MSEKVILLGPLPPPYGGVAIYMSALREFVRGRGVRTWSYPYQERKEPDTDYFKHKRLGIVPLLIRDGFKARILDASHFHIEYPNPILVTLWTALKPLLRFDWVKVIHDGSLPSRYDNFGPARRSIFRLAVRSVTEFIVVNEDLNLWLRNKVKVKQKISVIRSLLPIPPGAFDAASTPLPTEIDGAIEGFRKRVCSIGVFIPDYGFRDIADGLEKIRRDTGENIGLILIDGAFICDENYRSEVLQQRDWITVVSNVAHPEVLRILKKSDVFVRGFRFESYGLSRVEAIWCGLPVVATDVGETRGMLLYDYGDEEELIRQIKEALFNPPVQQTQTWAEQFQREAQENLRALMKTLGLN